MISGSERGREKEQRERDSRERRHGEEKSLDVELSVACSIKIYREMPRDFSCRGLEKVFPPSSFTCM